MAVAPAPPAARAPGPVLDDVEAADEAAPPEPRTPSPPAAAPCSRRPRRRRRAKAPRLAPRAYALSTRATTWGLCGRARAARRPRSHDARATALAERAFHAGDTVPEDVIGGLNAIVSSAAFTETLDRGYPEAAIKAFSDANHDTLTQFSADLGRVWEFMGWA